MIHNFNFTSFKDSAFFALIFAQAKIASCQAKAKPLYLKQVEGLFFRYPVKPTIMSDLSDLMVQIGLLLRKRLIIPIYK